MSATLAFLGEFGDAIDWIFNSRESQAGGAQVGGAENLPLLWTHLKLTAARERAARRVPAACERAARVMPRSSSTAS